MPEAGRHIFSEFDRVLEALRGDALLMASLANRNLANARAGFERRDDDLCATAIADDEEVDLLEKQLDRAGLDALIRFQPFSSDLRRVLATIKISTHLERISDQAAGIGRRARRLNAEEAVGESALLLPVFDAAQRLAADAVRAFAEGDAALAHAVIAETDRVQKASWDADDELSALLEGRRALARGYVHLIAVAQHLERVADSARNIAEDTVFMTSARDVRHPDNRLEDAGVFTDAPAVEVA